MSCLLCLALAAAPVQAGDIVVTGKAKTPEEERVEIRDYIRKTGIAKGETPAARWKAPVCPKVYGAKPEIASIVVARVRAVAVAANIKTANANCKPNIAIAFVEQGAMLAKMIDKQSRRHLGSVDLRDKQELFRSETPVRWWYAIGDASRRGGPSSDGGSVAGVGGGEGGQSSLAGFGPVFSGSGGDASLISSNAFRTITAATVVIDVNRAQGAALSAVADYAAFVALAEIDPPKTAPQQSVLTLFAGGADGLTQRDRDFLTALYTIPLDRQAYQQRAQLTGKLVNAAQD